MRQVNVSGYWRTNLGDDLFLEVLCKRYPKVQFRTEIDKENSKVFEEIANLTIEETKSEKGATITRFIQMLLEKVRGKKRISIEIGGSIFMFKKKENVYKSLSYIKRKITAFCSDSLYFLGCNFGPYDLPEQVQAYKEYFKKVDDICFRDYQSYKLFEELPNVRFAPDIVLSLNTSHLIQRDVPGFGAPYIVFSTINLEDKKDPGISDIYSMMERYEEFLLQNIKSQIKSGKHVVLFSFCDYQKDDKVNQRLFDKLTEEEQNKVVLYSHKNINDSLLVISRAEKLVASRFHGMILGWVFSIPTYVISYSKKTTDVIHSFVENQTYISLSDIIPTSLIKDDEFYKIDSETLKNLSSQSEQHFQALDKKFSI